MSQEQKKRGGQGNVATTVASKKLDSTVKARSKVIAAQIADEFNVPGERPAITFTSSLSAAEIAEFQATPNPNDKMFPNRERSEGKGLSPDGGFMWLLDVPTASVEAKHQGVKGNAIERLGHSQLILLHHKYHEHFKFNYVVIAGGEGAKDGSKISRTLTPQLGVHDVNHQYSDGLSVLLRPNSLEESELDDILRKAFKDGIKNLLRKTNRNDLVTDPRCGEKLIALYDSL